MESHWPGKMLEALLQPTSIIKQPSHCHIIRQNSQCNLRSIQLSRKPFLHANFDATPKTQTATRTLTFKEPQVFSSTKVKLQNTARLKTWLRVEHISSLITSSAVFWSSFTCMVVKKLLMVATQSFILCMCNRVTEMPRDNIFYIVPNRSALQDDLFTAVVLVT